MILQAASFFFSFQSRLHRSPQRWKYLLPETHQHFSNSSHPLSPWLFGLLLSISSSPIFPFPRNQPARLPPRPQKPASLSASAALLQRLVQGVLHKHTRRHARISTYITHCYLWSKEACRFHLVRTLHGCGALWLRLVYPFRSLAHAHPLVPFALLSLTLAPSSGLSLLYFLRPPHLNTPLDPTPPHPHQRFLAGRFVFICNFTLALLSFNLLVASFFFLEMPSCTLMSVSMPQSPLCCRSSSSVSSLFSKRCAKLRVTLSFNSARAAKKQSA